MWIWKMRWCSGPTSTDCRLSASRSLPRSLNRALPISLNTARYPPHRAAASCGEFGRGPNFQSKTTRAKESRRSSTARFSRASRSRASATSASIEKSRSRDARSPIRWISSKALPPFSTRISTRRSSDATAVRTRFRISRRSCVWGRFGFAMSRLLSVVEPESLCLARLLVENSFTMKGARHVQEVSSVEVHSSELCFGPVSVVVLDLQLACAVTRRYRDLLIADRAITPEPLPEHLREDRDVNIHVVVNADVALAR